MFSLHPEKEVSLSAIVPTSVLFKFSMLHVHWFSSLSPSSHCLFDKVWFNFIQSTYHVPYAKHWGREAKTGEHHPSPKVHGLWPRMPSSSMIAHLGHNLLWKTVGSFQTPKSFSMRKALENSQGWGVAWGWQLIKFCLASEDSSKRRKPEVCSKITNKRSPWLPGRLGWDDRLFAV